MILPHLPCLAWPPVLCLRDAFYQDYSSPSPHAVYLYICKIPVVQEVFLNFFTEIKKMFLVLATAFIISWIKCR